MKVFVTGATGFVGQEVVRQLHARGHTLRILARKPGGRHAQALASRYGAELIPGTLVDATALGKGVRLSDAVIHLVGIISEAGDSTFEAVHIQGTAQMAEAARRAGIKRFVHMSALGTRPNAVSRYHRTKWAAEETVRQAPFQHTIFRPSLIYGAQDHLVNLFARAAKFSPILPVMGSESARFQPVSVEVVAQAFVKALDEPRAAGRAFDLCGPEIFTFREILQQILEVCRKRRLILHVPEPLARCQACFLEFAFGRLLSKPPPLNRDQLVMLQEDNVGDSSAANDLLGLTHPTFRQGIAAYLT